MKKELTAEQKEQIFRLRKIREDLGFSQEQFADILGISISAYKKIECHERGISLTNLKKLYEKFHVSTDYILFGKKSGVEDTWKEVINCTEVDKVVIFLRLFDYFSYAKDEIFPKAEETPKHMKDIFRYMENIQNAEKKDAT